MEIIARHKKLIIIIISSVLVVGILAAIILLLPKRLAQKTQLVDVNNNYLPGITSMSNVEGSNDTIHVFNGRNFVAYDYVNNKSSAFFSDMDLPPISDMRWSQDGNLITFKSGRLSSDDSLGKIINQKNLNINNSYYWVADLRNKALNPLDTRVDKAFPMTNEVIYTVSSELDSLDEVEEDDVTRSNVYSLNPEANVSKKLFSYEGQIAQIFKLKNGNDQYIIQEIGDQKVPYYTVDSTGQKNILLESENNIFQLSPDSNHYFYFIFDPEAAKSAEEGNNGIEGRLVVKNIVTNKTVKEIDKLMSSDSFAWSNDSQAIIIYGLDIEKNELYLKKQAIASQNVTLYETKNKKAITQPDSYQLFSADNENSLFMVQPSGIGYVGINSANQPNNQNLSSTYSDDSSAGFTIREGQSHGKLSVSIYSNPITTYHDKAITHIKSKGVDPNIVNILFDYTIALEKE